jgi:hypothetical protein
MYADKSAHDHDRIRMDCAPRSIPIVVQPHYDATQHGDDRHRNENGREDAGR